jgi:hypothetical protein
MATSSARPVDLIEYTVDPGYQYEALPSTYRLDHLMEQVQSSGAEWLTKCYVAPSAGIEAAVNGAKELDTWVGLVGAGFAKADGGAAGGGVVTVDDDAVIENLPPLLADPPAEVRERVQEGLDLYEALERACDERDHDEIERILALLEDRSGEDALMAGFASGIGEGGEDAFQEMLEDGMRPKDRPGFLGGVVDFLAGAWDAVWGTVTFLYDLSTIRMVLDPDGWAESVGQVGEGVMAAFEDPGAFLEALIDVDGFLDNPERWLGQFAPDVIITVLTAGGGAAKRGINAIDNLDELGDLARTLRVVDDLDVAVDTTHAFRRILNEFDGDIGRTRDALRTYLVDELGLSPADARFRADVIAGNEFNRLRSGIGTQLSEVELGPTGQRGPRVDAWDPVTGEIISRKFTQLWDVDPGTARGYIDELVNKYEPGQEVKITPTVIRKAEQAGLDVEDLPTTLEGRPVLEVPPQTGDIDASLLDYAREQGVTIRDTEGTVLNP